MTKQDIQVCKPKLPLTEKIVPYLQQIDDNRWYSNFGPLHQKFSARLAQLFQIDTAQMACGTTGTQLLELALRALEITPDSLCVMPSWTFVATPLAALSANLAPLFVDVDLETGALDPVQLLADLPQLLKLGKIGAVIVTAPFGKPVDTLAWDNFTAVTGIPVLIDAAAAFDSMLQSPLMQIRKTPMMVSLHATKVFGIGEGGVLFSTNAELIQRIESMTQFGFLKGQREAQFRGTNIKMSEYTCAVGLAALDDWPATRSAWQAVTSYYQQALKQAGLPSQSTEWVNSTFNIIVSRQADNLLREMDKHGIMTRKWWGNGCHHQPVFQKSLRASDLANTEILQKSTLGLPFYQDMEYKIIDRIVNSIGELSKNLESENAYVNS